MPRLLRQLGATSAEIFGENYGRAIDEALGRGDLTREPVWTESLAVGSQAFASRVGGSICNRMKVEIQATAADSTVWIAKEIPAAYG